MIVINKNNKLITISILSALGCILMLVSFPLPLLPPYLTVDFGDIPAFIGFIIFGPLAGIAVLFIKIVLYGLIMASEPIGPIANLLASLSLLVPMYFIYNIKRSTKYLIIGLLVGIVSLTLIMSILNYFILLPMYGMITNLNHIVENLRLIITVGIIPFNIIKGIMVSIVALIVYKKLIPVITKKRHS